MKFLKILLPFCAFSGMDEEAPVYCQTENWNKVFINLVGAQKHFIMLINPILQPLFDSYVAGCNVFKTYFLQV